jgi:hypothetical protein
LEGKSMHIKEKKNKKNEVRKSMEKKNKKNEVRKSM